MQSRDYTRAMKDLPQKRTIRSYVLRQGRMTVAQSRAIEHLLPEYGLDISQTFDWQAIYGNQNPVVIEVGFGMGDSLVQMAATNPATNYLGIEVHGPGVGACLDMMQKQDLTNLRVTQHDAVEVLDRCVPNQSVAGFQIFFPDPWHKKRHHKRRLIQPNLIAKLVTKLEKNGFVHLATDWQNYAEQMMDVLSANANLVNTAGDYGYADGRKLRPGTKFEARGKRLGHGVWDLLFRLK